MKWSIVFCFAFLTCKSFVSSFHIPITNSHGFRRLVHRDKRHQKITPKSRFPSCTKRGSNHSIGKGDFRKGELNPLYSISVENVVDKIENPFLRKADKILLQPIVRIANHIPTLFSLYYFGLVSMVSMMSTEGMIMNQGPATFASVITKIVGKTSNAEFSSFFPTYVTPANFVFFIWPVIAATQLISLSFSLIFAALDRKPIFNQDELTALSLSNFAATSWIIVSSQASPGMLPLGSALVLPLVPLISGFPLRRKKLEALSNLVFQTFSSFTSIASLLALAVELQHGRRGLSIFWGRPELSALVFLSGYFGIVSRSANSVVKRIVNTVAIVGILSKRIVDASGPLELITSVSFWVTSYIASLATKKLFRGDNS